MYILLKFYLRRTMQQIRQIFGIWHKKCVSDHRYLWKEKRKRQKYIRGRGRDYQAVHVIGLPIRTHTSAFYMFVCFLYIHISRFRLGTWKRCGYQSEHLHLHSSCIFKVFPVFLLDLCILRSRAGTKKIQLFVKPCASFDYQSELIHQHSTVYT